MNPLTYIDRIIKVNNALGELKNKVVYIGGTTLPLYADGEVFEVRPTDDVDIIIEILNYIERTELEETLRKLGFIHDVKSGIICRYKIVVDEEDIMVDIVPTTDSSFIGFNNKWYHDGYKNSMNYTINEDYTIKILSAPYFIATKLEAFHSRGGKDGRTSHDFEDIVYIFENRTSIWKELQELQGSVKEYLKSEFKLLLEHKHILEWIDCHVEQQSPSATSYILKELRRFAL